MVKTLHGFLYVLYEQNHEVIEVICHLSQERIVV